MQLPFFMKHKTKEDNSWKHCQRWLNLHGAPAHRSVSSLNAFVTDTAVYAVVLTLYIVNFLPLWPNTKESAALIQ